MEVSAKPSGQITACLVKLVRIPHEARVSCSTGQFTEKSGGCRCSLEEYERSDPLNRCCRQGGFARLDLLHQGETGSSGQAGLCSLPIVSSQFCRPLVLENSEVGSWRRESRKSLDSLRKAFGHPYHQDRHASLKKTIASKV